MNDKSLKLKIIGRESPELEPANLGKCLQKYNFEIPLFQRPYSWDENHVKDLLDTIKDNMGVKRDAFLGSIIIAQKDHEHVWLIDGQQRITSFLVILRRIEKKLDGLVTELGEKEKYLEEQLKIPPQEFEATLNEFKTTRDTKSIIIHALKGLDTLLTKEKISREGSSSGELQDEISILEYIKSGAIEKSFAKHILNQIKESLEEMEELENETKPSHEPIIKQIYDYILERCVFCLIYIDGESNAEDYAIDIFNSLNSTGEPLTAFEILKSLVHKKEVSSDKELTKKLDSIEKKLRSIKRTKRQIDKYTDKLIGFRNNMNEEFHQNELTSFRDKRKLLHKIVGLDIGLGELKKEIENFEELHTFFLSFWEKVDKNQVYGDEDGSPYICLDFLRKINHYMVVPILYHFRNSGEEEQAEVLEACAAFTCLWRGLRDNVRPGGIDKQYQNITREISKNSSYSLDALKEYMKDKLENELSKIGMAQNDNKNKWVNRFKDVDIYGNQKMARFLLFVALHEALFDEKSKTFKESREPFLLRDYWNEKRYGTIEHVIPQKSNQTIHRVGNLTLLPQSFNSSLKNKSFAHKKLEYKKAIEEQKFEEMDMRPYIPTLKELVSYEKFEEEEVDQRGERLGESIWRTLAIDWLEWK